ncbi:hypothetical protein DFP72DRAFT_554476 [Ephemerocybe angulata]|uniref:Uncharacterized protein n=1 Tax=Ephemerocybe angulata TaxID=980116 RepID=A0A8H6M241_9AGAR|nr:hypothetical protein DFP72DRAFT_554476 [Tulosesus angulatus]
MKSPLAGIVGLALCTALFVKGAFAQVEYDELDARSAIDVPFADISERHIVDVPFQPSLRSFLEGAADAYRRALDERGDELAARESGIEVNVHKQDGKRANGFCAMNIDWGVCKQKVYRTKGSIYRFQWKYNGVFLRDPDLVGHNGFHVGQTIDVDEVLRPNP